MAPLMDLKGQVFGRLTVLKYHGKYIVGNHKQAGSLWTCRCECGNVVNVSSGALRAGLTKTCGSHPFKKHKLWGDPVYNTWQGMLRRCYTKTNPNYKNYGKRGIKVCESLRASPANIVSSIGPRLSTTMTINRIENDGHYSCGSCCECKGKGWPKNIEWTTRQKQLRNKRCTRWVSIAGIKKCATEWCQILKIPHSTFFQRHIDNVKPGRVIVIPESRYPNAVKLAEPTGAA